MWNEREHKVTRVAVLFHMFRGPLFPFLSRFPTIFWGDRIGHLSTSEPATLALTPVAGSDFSLSRGIEQRADWME